MKEWTPQQVLRFEQFRTQIIQGCLESINTHKKLYEIFKADLVMRAMAIESMNIIKHEEDNLRFWMSFKPNMKKD